VDWLFGIHFVQHDLQDPSMAFSPGILPVSFSSASSTPDAVFLKEISKLF
jgi:hypothetical protein